MKPSLRPGLTTALVRAPQLGTEDGDAVADFGVPVSFTRTLMLSLEDRDALARAVLEAAGRGF